MTFAVSHCPVVDLAGGEQLFALAIVCDLDAPQVLFSRFNDAAVPESEPVTGFIVKDLAERNDVAGPSRFVKHLIAHLNFAHPLPALRRR